MPWTMPWTMPWDVPGDVPGDVRGLIGPGWRCVLRTTKRALEHDRIGEAAQHETVADAGHRFRMAQAEEAAGIERRV